MLTLGVGESDVGDAEASFGQLGGDSLAAIQFAREVSELCGVSLPVSFVLDHSHSLRDITEKARCPLLAGSCTNARSCLLLPQHLLPCCAPLDQRMICMHAGFGWWCRVVVKVAEDEGCVVGKQGACSSSVCAVPAA